MLASALLFKGWELADGEIDLTVAANHVFSVPSGALFNLLNVRLVLTQLDGTLTSAPTASIGNNAAKTNMIASGANTLGTLAQYNASAVPALLAPGSGNNNLNTAGNNNTLVNTSTPITLAITVGAVLNTATVCKGRVFILGNLMAP